MPTKKWKMDKSESKIVYISNGKEWHGTKAQAQTIARSLRHLRVDRGRGFFGGRAGDVWEARQASKMVDWKECAGRKYQIKWKKLDYWTVHFAMYL